MILIDARLLKESALLRRKVSECRKIERDVKIYVAYEELMLKGECFTLAISRLANRFDYSPSTVKRAICLMKTPPWKRKRQRRPSLPKPPT